MTDYIANINTYTIGGDNFNSYYYMLPSSIQIASGNLSATSATTISLENLIPDDNYDYEVFIGADAYLQYSGNYASFHIVSGTVAYSNVNPNYTQLMFQEYARTSARYYNASSKWIQVKANDRNITIANTGAAQYTYELYFYGLRRLANNTTQNCISKINFPSETRTLGNAWTYSDGSYTDVVCYTLPNQENVGDYVYNQDLTTPMGTILNLEIVDNVKTLEAYILDANEFFARKPDSDIIGSITPPVLIGGDNYDGQPVQKYLSLFEGTMAVNNIQNFDLSSYLPNDNYDYMVDFGAFGRTTTSSSGYYHWYVGSGTLTASEITQKAYLMMATEYHSTNSYICSNNISIPIKANDRNVTFAVTQGTKTSDNCGLNVLGYRRIGKNMNEYSYIPGEYITVDANANHGIKYEDYLKIQKIDTTGKYKCDFYYLGSSTPSVMSNSNLMVYTDAQEATDAVSNWSSNTSDFPINEYTLITDLTSLNEIAADYRNGNVSFTQEGIIKSGNTTVGDAQILEIGEL